jgi:hypothetical protein
MVIKMDNILRVARITLVLRMLILTLKILLHDGANGKKL